jgi:hypothetical protein
MKLELDGYPLSAKACRAMAEAVYQHMRRLSGS